MASKEALMELRRSLIAALLSADPRITQRQILTALERKGLFNPDSGNPYSVGTINTDIKVIKVQWRERAGIDAEGWLSEVLAKLDELEKKGWTTGKPDLVLKCIQERNKLLGLYSPSRQEITGAGGGPIKTEDATLTDEERINRIAAIFDRARAKRDRQADTQQEKLPGE